MKIPKKLKIGGHTYKIVIKDGWDGAKANKDEIAYIDDEKEEIVIYEKLAQTRKEAVLFHEIFHGINSVLDHTLLDSLAEQVYQVLKDNDLLR